MRRSVSDSEEDEERQRILSRTQKEIDASRQREDNLIAHLRDYRGRMEELHRKVNIEMYPHIACLLYKNRSRILFVPKLLIQIILFNKHLRGKIVQISILYDFSQKFFFLFRQLFSKCEKSVHNNRRFFHLFLRAIFCPSTFWRNLYLHLYTHHLTRCWETENIPAEEIKNLPDKVDERERRKCYRSE